MAIFHKASTALGCCWIAGTFLCPQFLGEWQCQGSKVPGWGLTEVAEVVKLQKGQKFSATV